MGFLQEYNTQHGVKTTTVTSSKGGGGFLQQYNANPPKVQSPTPKISVKSTTVSSAPKQSNIFTTIGDAVKKVAQGLTLTFVHPNPANMQPLISKINQPKNSITIKPDQKKLTQAQLADVSPRVSGTSAQLKQTPELIKSRQKTIDAMDKVASTVSKLPNKLPQTKKSLQDFFADPFNSKVQANPSKFVSDVWDAVKAPFIKQIKLEQEHIINPPKTISGKINYQTSRVAGAVSILFTPITAVFTAAEKAPELTNKSSNQLVKGGGGLLSAASRLISLPFLAAGETGTKVSDKIIDSLPIPEQSKKTLKPGIGEIFALAAQLALGKAVEVGVSKKAELTKKYGETDANTIINQAKELAAERKAIEKTQKGETIKDSLPNGEVDPQEIINSIINSKHINTPEGKAVIKAAVEAKMKGLNIKIDKAEELAQGSGKLTSETPIETLGKETKVYRGAKDQTIDTTRPNGITGGTSFSLDRAVAERFAKREGGNVSEYTISPDARVIDHSVLEALPKDQVAKFLKDNNIDVIRFDVPKGAKGEAELRVYNDRVLRIQGAPLRPIGEGKTQVSGLSKGVEAKAIEEGLTKSLGDLPEYKQVSMKEQADFASKLIKEDSAKAVRIALGQEAPPSHILPESIFVAVEKQALKTGNLDLIQKLANSGLTGEATAMGQRIRTLGERNPESPVSMIRDVAESRRKAIEKRLGKTVDEAVKKTTADIQRKIRTPDKYDWGNFIKSIEC